MNEAISIIVPVYNAEKTLRRCVDSLTAQSHKELEILLINDGSKDDSLNICRELAAKDARIRVIDKPNGGVSSARNAGLDAATGAYVMFCDSDDWVEPQWCQAMLEACEPGDMAICGIARPDIPTGAAEGVPHVTTASRQKLMHFPLLMCSPVNKIYLNDVVCREHLRFHEKLRLGEDFVFVLSYLCAASGQLRILSQELYHYDVSTDGSLSKRAPALEQCELFYEQITAAMEKLGAMDKISLRHRDHLVMGQLESAMIAAAEDRRRSFCQKLRDAAAVGRMKAFRGCSGAVVQWGNPIYNWLFQKKLAKGIMLYLLLRNVKAAMAPAR